MRIRIYKRGFTLIELLIVIAIIAILALIAVPNFLESQVRAKVSRAVADMRTITTALESYAVDWGTYPLNDGRLNIVPNELTTPLAYLSTSLLVDPFAVHIKESVSPVETTSRYYTYMKIVTMAEALQAQAIGRTAPREATDHFSMNRGAFRKYGQWRMLSLGPDRAYLSPAFPPPLRGSDVLYDPSNGTMSFGNILRTQKSTYGKTK